MLMMSYLDVIDEWFEHPTVKAALARWVSEILCAPEEGGTGAFLLMMVPVIHRYGLGYAVGGSGSLTTALTRALTEHGGTVRTGETVERFLFDGDRVTGVALRSGAQITASRAVVADLNIKQIPAMTGHRFGDAWEARVRRIKQAGFGLLTGHLALSEAPVFRAGEVVGSAGFQEFAVPLPELRRTFDALKYGQPIANMPSIAVASAWDPTRARQAGRTPVPAELRAGRAGRGHLGRAQRGAVQQRLRDVLRPHHQHGAGQGPRAAHRMPGRRGTVQRVLAGRRPGPPGSATVPVHGLPADAQHGLPAARRGLLPGRPLDPPRVRGDGRGRAAPRRSSPTWDSTSTASSGPNGDGGASRSVHRASGHHPSRPDQEQTMSSAPPEEFDVIVIGGGPGGSTAATLTARQGHRVLLLEKEVFPRYQIGESLLPSTVHGIAPLLGVNERLREGQLPRSRAAARSGGAPAPSPGRSPSPCGPASGERPRTPTTWSGARSTRSC